MADERNKIDINFKMQRAEAYDKLTKEIERLNKLLETRFVSSRPGIKANLMEKRHKAKVVLEGFDDIEDAAEMEKIREKIANPNNTSKETYDYKKSLEAIESRMSRRHQKHVKEQRAIEEMRAEAAQRKIEAEKESLGVDQREADEAQKRAKEAKAQIQKKKDSQKEGRERARAISIARNIRDEAIGEAELERKINELVAIKAKANTEQARLFDKEIKAYKERIKALQKANRKGGAFLSPQEVKRITNPGEVIPFKTKLKTGPNVHEYEYTGKAGKRFRDQYGKPITVTELSGVITGENTAEFKKQAEVLREQARIERDPTKKRDLNRRAAEQERKIKNYGRAAGFGTAHHEIIDSVLKGQIKGDEASIAAEIIARAQREASENVPKENRVYSHFVDEKGNLKLNDKSTYGGGNLVNTIRGFLDWAEDERKHGRVVDSERSVGGLFNINGKPTPIAGTMDQLWLMANGNYALKDMKTTGEVKGSTSIQLGLLKKLLGSIGYKVTKQGVVHSSKQTAKTDEYDFEDFTDEELTKLLSLYQQIDAAPDEKTKASLREEAKGIWGGKMHGRFVSGTDSKGKRQFYYNGLTLNQMVKSKSPEEIRDIYNSLDDKGKRAMQSQLWSTKEYSGGVGQETYDELYRKGPKYRKLRSVIDTPMKAAIKGTIQGGAEFGEFEGEDGKRNSGVMLAGLHASEWGKAYRLAQKQARHDAKAAGKSDVEIDLDGKEAGSRVLSRMLNLIDNEMARKGEGWEGDFAYNNATRFLKSFESLGERSPFAKGMVDEFAKKDLSIYGAIQQYYNDDLNSRIGGDAQYQSKEDQAERRKRSTINTDNSELFKSIAKFETEGLGGIVEKAKGVSEGASIFDSLGNEINSFFMGIKTLRGEWINAIASLGNEGEMDEYGRPETLNSSLDIIEAISAFNQRAMSAIDASDMSDSDKEKMKKRLSSSLNLGDKLDDDITSQLGYRFTRGIAAKDFYDSVLDSSWKKANEDAKTRGGRQVSKEEYAMNVLSEEQFSQYNASDIFKKEYEEFVKGNKYSSFDAFMEEMGANPEILKSREFASFLEAFRKTKRMFPTEDLYGEFSHIIENQLFGKEGEYNPEKQFKTFLKGGWDTKILSGFPIDRLPGEISSDPRFVKTEEAIADELDAVTEQDYMAQKRLQADEAIEKEKAKIAKAEEKRRAFKEKIAAEKAKPVDEQDWEAILKYDAQIQKLTERIEKAGKVIASVNKSLDDVKRAEENLENKRSKFKLSYQLKNPNTDKNASAEDLANEYISNMTKEEKEVYDSFVGAIQKRATAEEDIRLWSQTKAQIQARDGDVVSDEYMEASAEQAAAEKRFYEAQKEMNQIFGNASKGPLRNLLDLLYSKARLPMSRANYPGEERTIDREAKLKEGEESIKTSRVGYRYMQEELEARRKKEEELKAAQEEKERAEKQKREEAEAKKRAEEEAKRKAQEEAKKKEEEKVREKKEKEEERKKKEEEMPPEEPPQDQSGDDSSDIVQNKKKLEDSVKKVDDELKKLGDNIKEENDKIDNEQSGETGGGEQLPPKSRKKKGKTTGGRGRKKKTDTVDDSIDDTTGSDSGPGVTNVSSQNSIVNTKGAIVQSPNVAISSQKVNIVAEKAEVVTTSAETNIEGGTVQININGSSIASSVTNSAINSSGASGDAGGGGGGSGAGSGGGSGGSGRGPTDDGNTPFPPEGGETGGGETRKRSMSYINQLLSQYLKIKKEIGVEDEKIKIEQEKQTEQSKYLTEEAKKRKAALEEMLKSVESDIASERSLLSDDQQAHFDTMRDLRLKGLKDTTSIHGLRAEDKDSDTLARDYRRAIMGEVRASKKAGQIQRDIENPNKTDEQKNALNESLRAQERLIEYYKREAALIVQNSNLRDEDKRKIDLEADALRKANEASNLTNQATVKQNESLTVVNRLLTESLRLKKEIAKEEQKIALLSKDESREAEIERGESENRLAELRGMKGEIDSDLAAELNSLSPEAQQRFKKTADVRTKLTDNAIKVQNSKMLYSEQDKTAREYEKRLNEQLQILSKIDQLEQRKATSISGREVNAINSAIAAQQQLLTLNQQDLETIEKKGTLREEDKKRLLTQANAERAAQKANNATTNHGSRNFWDLMAYDIKRSFTMIFDFGVAHRALSSLRAKITEVINTVVELDTAMMNLRIVTGDNAEQANDLIKSYNDLAKQLGTTTSEVAKLSTEWLRQGYTVNEVDDLVEGSFYLSKLGMIESGQATEYLTSMLKGFKMEASQTMEIVDLLTALDVNYAVSAGGIAEALSRTAVSAQMAGMSLDEVAAATTTVADITQKSTESIGESMKTLLSRYGNVKAGAFTSMVDGGGDESVNDTEKVLNALGISIRSSSMEFRSFSDVLDDVAEKWVTLSSVEKNAIATAMAGTRQRENFNALMENYSSYQDAIKIAEQSQGTSAEKWEAYNDSIAKSIENLKTAWEGFTLKLESNSTIKWLIDAAAWLVEKLPIIINMFVSLMTTLNAWKIPSWLHTAKEFFSFRGRDGGNGMGFASSITQRGMAQRLMYREAQWRGKKHDMVQNQSTYRTGLFGLGGTQINPVPAINSGVDDITNTASAIYQKEKLDSDNRLNRLLAALGVPQAHALNGPTGGKADGGSFGYDKHNSKKRLAKNYKKNEGRTNIAPGLRGMRAGDGVARTEKEMLLRNRWKTKTGIQTYGFGNKNLYKAEGNTLRAQVDRLKSNKKTTADAFTAEQSNVQSYINNLRTRANSAEDLRAQGFEAYADEIESMGLDKRADALEKAINAKNNKARRELAPTNVEDLAVFNQYMTKKKAADSARTAYNTSAERIELNARMQEKGRLNYDGVQYKQKNHFWNRKKKYGGSKKPVFVDKKGNVVKEGTPTYEGLANAYETKKARIKATALTAVSGAAMGGLTAAMTQEGSASDKAIAGATNAVTTGLLSAIPGIGPILGSTVGPIVGGFISDGILKLVHAEEIAMKKRVEEAQKQLEALNGIVSSVKSLSDSVDSKADWDSDDYEEINTYVSEILTELLKNNELSDRFNDEIKRLGDASLEGLTQRELLDLIKFGNEEQAKEIALAIERALAKEEREATVESQEVDRKDLSDKMSKYSRVWTGNWGADDTSYTDIGAAMTDMAKSFDEERTVSEMTDMEKYSAAAQYLMDRVIAMPEYGVTYDGGRVYVKGSTPQEQLENMKALREAMLNMSLSADENDDESIYKEYEPYLTEEISIYISELDEAIKNMEGVANDWKLLDEQLNSAAVENAVLDSIAAWDSATLKTATLEEAIVYVAENLSLAGENVYNGLGEVTSSARAAIESYLRAQEEYSSLFSEDETTLRQMLRADEERAKYNVVTADGESYDYNDLYDIFTKNTSDNTMKRETIMNQIRAERNLSSFDFTIEDFRHELFALDPQRLENYANVLHMTTEELKGMQGSLGGTTLSDFLSPTEDTITKLEKIRDIFSDITEGGTLGFDNYMNILNSFPDLLNKYDDVTGKVVSSGFQNVIPNLVDALTNPESGIASVLSYNNYSDIKSNENAYKNFKNLIKDTWEGDSSEIEFLDNFDTFNQDVLLLMSDNAELWERYETFIKDQTVNLDILKDTVQGYIDYQSTLLEQQIDSLESQKDALDDINDARQKELDLIKAKDALENAKKEKKLVYREGIGWAYQTDQTAIQEAKEKVDGLETDKDQEDLQYRIDQLEAEKAFLEAIPASEELEKAKEAFDTWVVAITDNNNKQVSILEKLKETYDGVGAIAQKFDEWLANDKKHYEAIDNTGMDKALGLGEENADQPYTIASVRQELQDLKENYNNASYDGQKFNEEAATAKNNLDTLKKYLEDSGIANYMNTSFEDLSEKDKFKFGADETAQKTNFEALKQGYKEFVLNGNQWNKMFEGKSFTISGINEWVNADSEGATQGGTRDFIVDWVGGGIGGAEALVADNQNGPFNDIKNKTEAGHYYDNVKKTWIDLGYYNNDLKDITKSREAYDAIPSGSLIAFTTGDGNTDPRYAYKYGENYYRVRANEKGNLSFEGGYSFVNEKGTEGIITPQGTLTALPSKTGIVPADITKNLWSLGEVAPNLIKRLDSVVSEYSTKPQNNSTEDNSTNINNLYATFQAEENFDFDKFLSEVRGVVNITKHGV